MCHTVTVHSSMRTVRPAMKLLRRLCFGKLSCRQAAILMMFVTVSIITLSQMCVSPFDTYPQCRSNQIEIKHIFNSISDKTDGSNLNVQSQNTLQSAEAAATDISLAERKILNYKPYLRFLQNKSQLSTESKTDDTQTILQEKDTQNEQSTSPSDKATLAERLTPHQSPYEHQEIDSQQEKAVADNEQRVITEPADDLRLDRAAREEDVRAYRRPVQELLNVPSMQQKRAVNVQEPISHTLDEVHQHLQSVMQPPQPAQNPAQQPQKPVQPARKPVQQAVQKPVQPARKPQKAPKRSSKKSAFTLPDNYPLFQSPYPAPVLANNHTCRDSMCSELLSERDLVHYKYCLAHQAYSKTVGYRKTNPGRCRFMDGKNRAAVALVSFPGSGNTWVRGLLEQATGVCTGSIYCDNSLRGDGFNGEGMMSGTVIAVKTHKTDKVIWTDRDKPAFSESQGKPRYLYGAAILIVRNPFNAMVAEWTRLSAKFIVSTNKTNSHVNSPLGKEYFGGYAAWNSFVHTKIVLWQSYFSTWLLSSEGRPVLVVRYEDFKRDAFPQVKKMLDFLDFPYSEEALKRRMEQDYGTFKRSHHEEFEHFTPDQKLRVVQGIEKVMQRLKESKYGKSLGIEEYMLGQSQ